MKARLILQVSAAAVWLSLGVGCNQQNNQPVPAPEPQKLPPSEPAQRSVDATPPTLATNAALLDAAKTPAAIPISTLAETAAADSAKAAALPVAELGAAEGGSLGIRRGVDARSGSVCELLTL